MIAKKKNPRADGLKELLLAFQLSQGLYNKTSWVCDRLIGTDFCVILVNILFPKATCYFCFIYIL